MDGGSIPPSSTFCNIYQGLFDKWMGEYSPVHNVRSRRPRRCGSRACPGRGNQYAEVGESRFAGSGRITTRIAPAVAVAERLVGASVATRQIERPRSSCMTGGMVCQPAVVGAGLWGCEYRCAGADALRSALARSHETEVFCAVVCVLKLAHGSRQVSLLEDLNRDGQPVDDQTVSALRSTMKALPSPRGISRPSLPLSP
jgi:hypothetical protein